LLAPAVEKRSWFRLALPNTRNPCGWNISKNRDLLDGLMGSIHPIREKEASPY